MHPDGHYVAVTAIALRMVSEIRMMARGATLREDVSWTMVAITVYRTGRRHGLRRHQPRPPPARWD